MNKMNEAIIVTHPGDKFDNIINTAIDVVKVSTISYVLVEFNGCKVFVKKDTTPETAMADYLNKLKNMD